MFIFSKQKHKMNLCSPEKLSSLVVNCFFSRAFLNGSSFYLPNFLEDSRMGGPSGNPYANNRHADVLNEEPTDETAKLRLCEEVKNRAKGSACFLLLLGKTSG